MLRLRILTGVAAVAAAAGAALVVPGVGSAASSSPWVSQALPQSGISYGLAAVSCPTSASCIALGGPGESNAVLWNGTTWTATTLPAPVTGDGPTSISCPAATNCTAVGDYTVESGDTETVHMYADQLSGGTWTLRSLPLWGTAVSVATGSLASVSCASATSCTAVGYFTGPTGNRVIPLVERWNGATWTARSAPVTRATSGAYLDAVSCATVRTCTAVGYYYPTRSGVAVGLAEQWNGTAWAFQPVPLAATSGSGEPGRLLGISCPAAGDCTAVGDAGINGVTQQIAERYQGGTWTYQAVPGPRSETGGELESVSCVGTACTATGNYTKPLVHGVIPTETLADVTAGGAWSYQATVPPPRYYTGGDLPSVSCTAATTCTAVGYFAQQGPGGGALPLAERK